MRAISGRVGVIRDSVLSKKRVSFSPNSHAKYNKNNAANFGRLQDMIAFMGYHNPGMEIFVRGQKNDYTNTDKESILLATLYREENNFKTNLEELLEYDKKLLELLKNENNMPGMQSLITHEEARHALLQHYQVCKTPFLDITRNTRVAATFATHNLSKDDSPHIFVFGLPYLHGNITHNFSENINIINLRNTLGHYSKRPHEQEGYLMGSLYDWKNLESIPYHDGRMRLLTKIKLDIKAGEESKFWGYYNSINMKLLIPEKTEDRMLSWLIEKQMVNASS